MFFFFVLFFHKSLCASNYDNNVKDTNNYNASLQQSLRDEIQRGVGSSTHSTFINIQQQVSTFRKKNNDDIIDNNSRTFESNPTQRIKDRLIENNTSMLMHINPYTLYTLLNESLIAISEIEHLKDEILIVRTMIFQQKSDLPLNWYIEGKFLETKDKQKLAKDLIQALSLAVGMEDPNYHQFTRAFISQICKNLENNQNGKSENQKLLGYQNTLNNSFVTQESSISNLPALIPIESRISSFKEMEK